MHERWLILAILTFARTTMGFQFQSAAAVSSFLLDQFQMTYAALGTIIGLYLLPGIVVALPGGMMAQRFGDKRVACIGLAAMAIGGMLMGAFQNSTALAAGRILSGAGAVVLNVIVTKMVTDWFSGRDLVTALGILITSWPLGISLALVLLPGFAGAFSWPAAMHATAVLSAVALALVAARYRAPATSPTVKANPLQFDLTRRELGLATLAGLVWTFYNIAFIILPAFGPEFLVASGYGTADASAIVSVASWTIIPGLSLGAWIVGRIGRPDLTMVACFLLAGLAIGFIASAGASIALFAAIGLIFGPPGGLIMTLPGEAVRPERRAIAMGIYFSCYYAGMGVLPALAGFARDVTGHAGAPLWFAAATLVAAAMAVLQFRFIQARPPQAR